MKEGNLQIEIIDELKGRRKNCREYLRSLSLAEKSNVSRFSEKILLISHLHVHAKNGSRPIPEKWLKWNEARYQASQADSR